MTAALWSLAAVVLLFTVAVLASCVMAGKTTPLTMPEDGAR